MKYCEYCKVKAAKLKRSKNGMKSCIECFYFHFEEEIHQTIMEEKLFNKNDKIILAISGGKDSTVLINVMTTLKKRHKYPITLELLAIDEGIKGYRDDSLLTVVNNSKFYNLPLKVKNYTELFGRTMDNVVEMTGVRTSCTYCGVFRRKALNIGLHELDGDRLFTGHNADDMAETILMNLLRGDTLRLVRSTNAISGEGKLIRCKPFKYTYEKEIVLYAHYKKLDYFSTECTYSKEAFRGYLKELMKHLMTLRPGVIEDIIRESSKIQLKKHIKIPDKKVCELCKSVTSNKICKSCLFKQELDDLAIKKETKTKKIQQIKQLNQINQESDGKFFSLQLIFFSFFFLVECFS